MKKIFFIVMCICCLNGCAVNSEYLPLNYTLEEPKEKIYQNKHHQTIAVIVNDKRGVNDNRLILSKVGPYGTVYQYGYLAEEPIKSILKKAFSSGFQQMNYDVLTTNHSRYVFNCDINKIELKTIREVFTGTLILEIEINYYLFDNNANKMIWQDMIIARGKVTNSFGSNQDIIKACNLAITDLIRETQKSRMFNLLN